MKKLQIFAFAALVAIGFSSCIKEQGSEVDANKKKFELTIKMAGTETRAITGQADPSAAITVSTGRIFIFDEGGAYVTSAGLNSGFTSGNGQTITTLVPENAQVYVVLNQAAALNSFTGTLAQLQATAYDVDQTTTLGGVTLANQGGTAVEIVETTVADGATPTDATAAGTADAEVKVAPVSAVLELVSVRAKDITNASVPSAAAVRAAPVLTSIVSPAVKVTGVYLNSYYPQYTLAGSFAGTRVNQTTPTAIGDATAVNFAAGVAKNGSNVWQYKVAAGASAANSPKLIVTMNNTGGSTGNKDKTLAISGYGSGFTGFKAGSIYRIQSIDFAAADWDAIPTPTLDDYELTVEIEVVNWTLVDNLEPVL